MVNRGKEEAEGRSDVLQMESAWACCTSAANISSQRNIEEPLLWLMKSTRPVLFVYLSLPPPVHCVSESLNHLPVRWNERIHTRWPGSWSSGSGCSCRGWGLSSGPGHILSSCRGLARHSVLTSCRTATVVGLRSQILVLCAGLNDY